MSYPDPEAHLPESHSPLPSLNGPGGPRIATPEEFKAVQDSDEFQGLRKAFRSFAFPMAVAFLVWYFAYVLMSTYAEDLMSTPVWGNLNLGLLFGLGQFVTTFLITYLYVGHANRNLDPVAAKLRDHLEGEL